MGGVSKAVGENLKKSLRRGGKDGIKNNGFSSCFAPL